MLVLPLRRWSVKQRRFAVSSAPGLLYTPHHDTEEEPVRSKPLQALLAIACVLALTTSAGCSADGTLRLPTSVVYPSITPVEGAAEQTVTHTFSFEGKPRAITVIVDGPLLAGARSAEKSVIRFGRARENDWIEDYYPAFVFDRHLDPFFAALIAQLRTIRDADGLDADRYVELMTTFVQSIEYQVDPGDLSPKFPVETFADQNGDCDDKALLLGGLLAREGYDVAVLLFAPEEHVALGIRANGLGYRDTGYAYIETTIQGYVGVPPDSIGDGRLLESTPQILPLEGGDAAYAAADTVAAITQAADDLETRITALAGEIADADARLRGLKADVDMLKSSMDGLSASGDTAGYNALVPRYNAAVEAYNNAIADRNEIAARHNVAVQTHTYIREHLDDRYGTFQYLRTHGG